MATANAAAATSASGLTILTGESATAATAAASTSALYTCSPGDTGQGCSNSSTTSSGDGLSQYYFVFLALIICVAGVGAWLVWRRKRRARRWAQGDGREDALAEDASGWDPAGTQRRRHRHDGWRGGHDASREEGLNEHGEAPPPYVPKSAEEERAVRESSEAAAAAAAAAAAGPAVPMQTLAREDAGLKPPDYTHSHVRDST